MLRWNMYVNLAMMLSVKFNIVSKEYFTINSEKPLNLTERKNQVDCKLFFGEETYYVGLAFPLFYDAV